MHIRTQKYIPKEDNYYDYNNNNNNNKNSSSRSKTATEANINRGKTQEKHSDESGFS